MILRSRPVLVTLCDKCGGAFHGCVFTSDALFDKELLTEIEGYAREGYEIKVIQASEYKWCECDTRK